MAKQSALRQLAEVLERSEQIVITTHIKADGDGIGSELALKRALAGMGKDARIINDTPVPQPLKFMLDEDDEIIFFEPARDRDFILSADLIVVVDVALLYRLGRMQSFFEASRAQKICVDHHLEGDDVFDKKLVEPDATSTGELIFDLLKELDCELTPAIANALYTSIVVDSGCLSYERCVSKTFLTVAELVDKGACPYDVHLALHWKKTLPELKLEGDVISKLKVRGEVAYSHVTSEMARTLAVDPMEMPELVHIPLALGEVEIALLFIENGGNEIKVSARSKGRVKVCELARIFGGGGHSLAAGFVLDGPLENAIETVVGEAVSFLKRS